MIINERRHLVLPLYRSEDEPYAWVHSAPIPYEVFASSYVLLSKAFTALHVEGIGEITGPRVAALALRDVARSMAGESGDPEQIVAPVVNEIRRLTNVLMPGASGWDMVPFEDAMRRGLLDEEDLRDADNLITFFTLGWHLYPRSARQVMMDGASRPWGAQMLSLNCTDYLASLRTSRRDADTGEKQVTGRLRVGTTSTMVAADGQVQTLSVPS